MRRRLERIVALAGQGLIALLVLAGLALALTGRAGGAIMGLGLVGVAVTLYRVSVLERRMQKLQDLLTIVALRHRAEATSAPERGSETGT